MLKKPLLFVALFLSQYMGLWAQISVHNAAVGRLSETLTTLGILPDTLTAIKITGELDARDFETLRPAKNTLKYVDLSEITIRAYDSSKHYDHSLPHSSFHGFSALHTVLLPSPGCSPNPLRWIYPYAFADCSSLRSITFPKSLSSIWDRAFLNTPISDVILPDSLVFIGTQAFSGCYNLTSIHIPARVKHMYPGPFSGCRRLKEITVDPDNESYVSQNGVLYKTYLRESGLRVIVSLVQYPAGKEDDTFVIPSTVRLMRRYTLDSCVHLKKVVFSDSLFSADSFLSSLKNLETVQLHHFRMFPLHLPSEKLKAIYIACKEVPVWSGTWLLNKNKIDLSKITLYVRPELIAGYKKSPHFGPGFTYVPWVPAGVPQATVNPLAIYPNPVQDRFFIQGVDGEVSVFITDAQGREVFSRTVDAARPIDVNHLPPGVYAVRATDTTGKVYDAKMLK